MGTYFSHTPAISQTNSKDYELALDRAERMSAVYPHKEHYETCLDCGYGIIWEHYPLSECPKCHRSLPNQPRVR